MTTTQIYDSPMAKAVGVVSAQLLEVLNGLSTPVGSPVVSAASVSGAWSISLAPNDASNGLNNSYWQITVPQKGSAPVIWNVIVPSASSSVRTCQSATVAPPSAVVNAILTVNQEIDSDSLGLVAVIPGLSCRLISGKTYVVVVTLLVDGPADGCIFSVAPHAASPNTAGAVCFYTGQGSAGSLGYVTASFTSAPFTVGEETTYDVLCDTTTINPAPVGAPANIIALPAGLTNPYGSVCLITYLPQD